MIVVDCDSHTYMIFKFMYLSTFTLQTEQSIVHVGIYPIFFYIHHEILVFIHQFSPGKK